MGLGRLIRLADTVSLRTTGAWPPVYIKRVKGTGGNSMVKLNRDAILDIIKRGRNGNEIIILIDSLIKSDLM